MTVFRIGDSQRRRGCVPVTPVNRSTGTVNVKAKPVLGMRLVELDISGKERTLFSCDTQAVSQLVREVRFKGQSVVKKFECSVTQCALRLWRAVVWHSSCANILSRFRPGPGYHAIRQDMT